MRRLRSGREWDEGWGERIRDPKTRRSRQTRRQTRRRRLAEYPTAQSRKRTGAGLRKQSPALLQGAGTGWVKTWLWHGEIAPFRLQPQKHTSCLGAACMFYDMYQPGPPLPDGLLQPSLSNWPLATKKKIVSSLLTAWSRWKESVRWSMQVAHTRRQETKKVA